MQDKIDKLLLRLAECERELGDPDILADQKRFRSLAQEHAYLQEVKNCQDEILQQEQNYLNNWWERKDLEVEWVVKNGGSLELTNAATGNLFAVYKQVCMTKEDCVTAAAKMGMQVLEGDFPSKGCFMKNDMAFWSEGSTSQISVVGLPGVQMRIFCESETTSATKSLSAYIDSSISSAYMDSTAIGNADIDSNVGSTTIDSSKNVGLPPTKLSTSGSMVLTVGGNGAILMMAMLLWV